MSRDPREAVSTLTLGLKDSDPEVQVQAANLVSNMHAASRATSRPGWSLTDEAVEELVPALLEGTKSPDARVRRTMLSTLTTPSFGPSAHRKQQSAKVTAR